MKKMTRFILLLTITAFLFTSCNKPANTLAKYIPKDANIVFELNTKSMLDKLSSANISFDSLARVLSDEGDSSQTNISLEELRNSGIDTAEAAFGFVKNSSSIMAGQSTSGGMVAALKNAAAFEALLKKKKPAGEIKKADNYSYLALGDDFIAGWTDNVVIIAQKHGGSSAPGTYATGEGTLTQQMLTALFAQKESESILSVDGFKDVLKQNADLAFYTSSSNMQSITALGISKLGDLTDGSYTTGTVTFENGKITASFNAHLGNAMADLVKKYPMHAIDVSMLDKYPGQIQGFVIGSLNPKLFPAVFQYVGFDGVANTMLQQQLGLNLTISDIFQAIKGDFAIAVSDIGFTKKTVTEMGGYKLPQPVTTNVPSYKVIANFAIDKDGYNKVTGVLAQKGVLTQQNGQYQSSMLNSLGLSMSATDNNLYISTSADLIKQYESASGNASNLPADIHDKLKGKVFAMYADIQTLSGKMQSGEKDSTAPTFKDVIVTADNLNDKTSTGNAEIRLLNNNENSLVTLLRYSIKQAQIRKMRKMDMSAPHM